MSDSRLVEADATSNLETRILPVPLSSVANVSQQLESGNLIESWELKLADDDQGARNIHIAAQELREGIVPVAFPTETVYGLGADATRSDAVRGIYLAKQRPSDNPLIVHVHSLQQLRALLTPVKRSNNTDHETLSSKIGNAEQDVIPAIYRPLIQKFWPGPLTLLFRNPPGSSLAPEVTAGLSTFGARMPKSVLALALIKLADVPLAAPSANASTKPSPTTAEHVKNDLNGRISTILDGGSCDIGVESTVVDGLSDPPLILRPGGISIDQLRSCPGWEKVALGYKDSPELKEKPKAPGMKYKHYSPRASVILYEWPAARPTPQDILRKSKGTSIGVIRTQRWPKACGLDAVDFDETVTQQIGESPEILTATTISSEHIPLAPLHHEVVATKFQTRIDQTDITLWDIDLGHEPAHVAQGLFAALRLLDLRQVDTIFVEGVDDSRGDVSTAVMNRLRKAAEVKVKD